MQGNKSPEIELFDSDLVTDNLETNNTDILELPREVYQYFKTSWQEVYKKYYNSLKPPTSSQLKGWWKNWYSSSFDDCAWYEKWEDMSGQQVASSLVIDHDQHDLMFNFCSKYIDGEGGQEIYGAFIEFVSKFVFNGELIDFSSLDPFLLKSIPIDDRDELPEEPGIYFVIDTSNIYYIGMSIDLNKRWYSHHRQDDFDQIPDLKIAYLDGLPPHYLRSIESVLIKNFTPRLNIQGNPLVRSPIS